MRGAVECRDVFATLAAVSDTAIVIPLTVAATTAFVCDLFLRLVDLIIDIFHLIERFYCRLIRH